MPSFDGVLLLFIFFSYFCCACCKFIFSHRVQLCGSHALFGCGGTAPCLHFRVAVASLWCIRCLLPAACCLGLNCKTWPFKNAPRLPKLWQCLELCWGPSSEITTTTTTTKSENFVTKVKRAARCYCAEWQRGGNGSRHRSHCGCGQSYATGALKNLWKLIFLNGKLKRQLNAKRSICESGHEFYWHFHLKRVSVCVCHKVENE